MSFKKWLNGFEQAFHDSLLHHAETHGLKMKNKYTALIPEGLQEQALQLYIAYRNQKTNKMLVWATWFLAILTMILIIISFIIK